MQMIRLAALVGVVGAAAFTVGCGAKEQPAQAPMGMQQTPTAGGIPGADQGTGVPTTAAPAGSTAAPTSAAPAGVTGTAQVIDPNMAAVATGALAGLAGTNAPGAATEGPVMAGNFATGQNLEYTFNMQPGKCYTVVGTSVGITQLDATAAMVTPLPGLNAQFGAATGKAGVAGSQVILGAKDKCLKLALSPIAVPVKVTVTATKGAGLGAAQIYVK
jgi:hypothetical protein